MKNSHIVDVLKDGNLVIPLFLLKNYKKYNLEIGEFLFLMFLYNKGTKFLFNPQEFGDSLNFDLESVMNYIGLLTDKGFIRVEVLKNDRGLMEEYILLDDFYQKITLNMMEESNKSSDDSINVFEIIEKEFGRTLSPIEYEIIKAWVDNNISTELIKEAVKEATFNGVSNLRYIDKILYEWGKANIKSVSDVEAHRKKRSNVEKKDPEIDIDIVDWNWFDDE